MSRLSRSKDGSIRTWSPAESPLRIEYPQALLREVRLASPIVDAFGLLYGVRNGNTIRVDSTRGSAGLEPVGVFSSRVRGAIFLAEEDLERFEKAEAQVALVISDESAGFFVRDAAGSIETVRSYEEFSICQALARPVRIPTAKRPRNWIWAACLLLALLVLFSFKHRQSPPLLAINVREDAMQLRISWNTPTEEKLTIVDGGERTFIPITREQWTATYARRTGDVTVGIGAAQVRFVGLAPPDTEMDRTRETVARLRSRIAKLRAAQAYGQTRIATLQRRLQ